jgi:hypothetical protein
MTRKVAGMDFDEGNETNPGCAVVAVVFDEVVEMGVDVDDDFGMILSHASVY